MTHLLHHEQTPMSSKLTNMLILLREEIPATISDNNRNNIRGSVEDQADGDNEDIILGGDLCNCRKSKCLKLYCQCFNAARVCNDMCRCVMCANTDSNEGGRSEAVKIILDRNPSAFDSKFLSRDLQAHQPAHKSGCKCRKSMCLKKYCECFEASLPCSSTCICIDCHNTPSDIALIASRQIDRKESTKITALPSKTNRSSRISGKHKGGHSSYQTISRKSVSPVEVTKSDSRYLSCGVVESDEDSSSSSASRDGSGGRNFSDTNDRNDSIVGYTCGGVGEKGPSITSGLYTRPPIPQSKKSCFDSLVRSSSNADNICTSELFVNGIGTPYLMRPTMLSRVVTVRKRAKHQIQNRHSTESVLSMQAHWLPPNDGKITSKLRSVSDEERCCRIFSEEFHGIKKEPFVFLSPGGVTTLPFSQPDRTGATTDDFKRFASPNTASVASALSLLSRLPFYEKSQ